jgi:alpha-2-macroglobulin-like protein/alpha-2-macroglobulin family protein/MG2 domain-containing protein
MSNMNKLLTGLLITLTAIIFTASQLRYEETDFNEKWQNVERFVKKGQPRSAIKIIDEIYTASKKLNNTPQVIKSLIYRVSLQSHFEEDYFIKSIDFFKKEISTASSPEKQILQSLVAELYHSYYEANRWKMLNRQILAENKNDDISTWDAITINKEIEKYYKLSLENEKELNEIPLKSYESILVHADSSNTTVYPFLFDLLANRAIDYYSSSDYELLQLATPPHTNNNELLAPASKFIKLNTDLYDKKTAEITQLFQKLIYLHLRENNTEAFVDIELKRLKYYFSTSNKNTETELEFLKTLTLLSKKYRNNPVYVSIAYTIASQYYSAGAGYSRGFVTSCKNNYAIADSICNVAVENFPNVAGSQNCRNLIEQINLMDFSFEVPTAQLPSKPTLTLIQFKNTEQLYFKIVEGDPKENANRHNRKEYVQNTLRKKDIKSWMVKLPPTNDHRSHTVEGIIPELPNGYYIIFASNDSLFKTTETIKFKSIWITNISYVISSNTASGFNEIYTLDRESGRGIGNVDITLYNQQYDNRSRSYVINEVGNISTDKTGHAKINSINGSNYGSYMFEFVIGNDRLMSDNYLSFHIARENKKPKTKTFLFTDRAVYRPGQTVYFKGIVTQETQGKVSLLKEFKTSIDFFNTNRKKISSIEFKTNQEGSFNGSFVIPVGGLNGQMIIKNMTGSTQFLVENYKLPTFEIVYDSLIGQPKLEETITVKGLAQSYAGSSIDGAQVRYRVTRKVNFPNPYYLRDYSWFPPSGFQDVEITNGITTTSPTGNFDIAFNALPDNHIPKITEPVFSYEITSEITDITGEIRIASKFINIGYKSVLLEINMPDVIEIDSDIKSNITARNLNGTNITLNVSIELYKLIPPEKLLINRQWSKPEYQVIPEDKFKGNFPHTPYNDENLPANRDKELIKKEDISVNGSNNIPFEFYNDLETGEYMIVVKGSDKHGNNLEKKQVFTLYSKSGKRVPGKKINWVATNKIQAEPGEIISLTIGTSTRKSSMMFEVVNGKNTIERKWIPLNRNQKTIDIPVLESYRGNFTINLIMVKYNRLYSEKLNIAVPYTNKKLDISLETFRNTLTPGQKEEWKVTISGENGNKLSAELLAGMYDASLDIFKTNNWQMNLYKPKHPSSNWESNQFNASLSSTLFSQGGYYLTSKQIEYPRINWFGYKLMRNNYVLYDKMDYNLRKSVVAGESMGMEEDNTIVKDKNNGTAPKNELQTDGNVKEIIPIRNNFNETAFFYPDLQTDESGNISFSFTTPDALTEWKMQVLAYTDDLKVGTLERKIRSQKELMIIPNVPRFVRQNDTLQFTAKITNFTNENITTTSSIEFYNPITMEQVNLSGKNISDNIETQILAKQSKSVSWEIIVPENISMLAYKITSTNGTFSDGEERMFPVLTNRMLVTTTFPMNIVGTKTKTFNFNEFADHSTSESLNNYKYTIEFTSNPSWYAIQALPYLSVQGNKNHISLFNKYFANSISSYIVNSNPKIKAVFESWKNITPDAFLSNLDKNQELKNTLITSTPWVFDAIDETEQKHRIGILFDVSRMANEKEAIINKLYQGQLSSGAWPWFKGMKADRHTTQSIALGMAKLHNKGVLDLTSDNRRLQMIRKAVNWLDARLVDDYHKISKTKIDKKRNDQIKSSHIQYLYLRSLLFDIIPIQEKSKTAFNYYTKQAKEHWLNKTNYLQGMIAISLNRFGYRNEAEAIIRSLKERSLFSKEMGMYWRQELGWNWYQAPVETQAMMIETMAELDNNPTVIEQLKVWMLKQKQTQHWHTSTATAEAIFALLMYGDNNLENNKTVSIKAGDKLVEANKDLVVEAGTGYFTTSWSGDEVDTTLANITVSNPNNGTAWGAAYWQYFEDMDKIQSHSTPLSIGKKLFIEKLTDNGPVLTEMEKNSILKPGDKIFVRITISTDRNMEYVHLKDMRATAFEPASQLSGYNYSSGLWYYKNVTDVSTEFYLRYLNKGTYILEYPLYVTQKGDFTNGIATIQSMYAPEFSAHSAGLRISVK